jgi:hypothetical protein
MRRILLTTVTALALVVTLSSQASAQWSFWSQGIPCSATGVVPRLDGIGTMAGGSSNLLTLTDGEPGANCFLVLGASSLRLPFKGGILGPNPDLILPISLDASGAWNLAFVWPAGTPAGTCVWLQVWCPDAGAPQGFCASNTLKATSS